MPSTSRKVLFLEGEIRGRKTRKGKLMGAKEGKDFPHFLCRTRPLREKKKSREGKTHKSCATRGVRFAAMFLF